MLTALQISDAIKIPFGRANDWEVFLNKAMAGFHIDTPKRSAAFLAQIAVESDGLTKLAENLNYSAKRLIEIFPHKFTVEEAEKYAGHPEMIGNRIYANRYGNGSEESGDGFKYRGRGLIQVTFKDNYEAIGDSLDIDLVSYPAQLLRSELAALSAALYWHAHGCNELADAGDIRGITRAINGGYNGLKQRLMYTAKANALLGVK